MNDKYIQLTYGQVALAAALILFSGAISVLLQLRLERRLMLAAARTVVQLLLLGLVLERVFAIRSWPLVACLMVVMTVIAATTATRRGQRRYHGVWFDSLLSMTVSAWLMSAIAMLAIVRPTPWFSPQYAIPLLGMILGNTLNGISLGLDRLTNEFSHREQIEGLLALGATRWEAARRPIQGAIRTGMIPTINSMMIVGVVSLPGMMTGQLLAGVAPIEAVKYQVVIMFLIASGTAIGTMLVVLLGYRRFFNANHQFLADQLRNRSGGDF